MYQWDEEKKRKNLAKHGVDFWDASTIFDSETVDLGTEVVKGEYRHKTAGMDGQGRILCVIHTERNGDTRIISARKAMPKERKRFRRKIGNAPDRRHHTR